MQYYGIENGLSQVTVNDMVFDDSGFLWIATEEGLNRFDGSLFKQFKNNPKDSLGLSGSFITKLFKDSEGNIWIGTARNGLNFYDSHKNTIQRVLIPEIDLSKTTVNGIVEGPESKIWISLENRGILKLDPKSFGTIEPQLDNNGSKILKLYKDSHDIVWGIYSDHIRQLNSNTNEIIAFDNKAMSLLRIGDKLFVGSENGFFEYNLMDQEMRKVALDTSEDTETIYVSSIIEYGENSLWIGTGNGLYLYDYKTGTVLNVLRKSEPNFNGLSNSTIQCLLMNKKEQLFVGTANGLNILSFTPSFFKNISKNIYGKHFSTLLNDNIVFSVYKEGHSYWIGTSVGGLNLIQEGAVHYFKEDKSNDQSIVGGTIRGIAKDERNNRLWFASTGGISFINLANFDPERPKFYSLRHDPEDTNSISSNFIRDIATDENGILWAATASEGVFSVHFDQQNNIKIKKYIHEADNEKSLASNNTFKITIDKENFIWVGTDNGLSRISPPKEGDTIVRCRNFKKTPSLISGSENVIYDILIDSQDRIWTGSRRGLSLMSENGEFESWYKQKQFPNEIIYSLLEDDSGHIWMATNQGLVRFDPEANDFSHYDSQDGIQSREFNLHAKFKDNLGVLYFGGIQGVTYFSPIHLDRLDVPQPIYLFEVRVQDTIVDIMDIQQTASSLINGSIKFHHNDFPFYLKFSTKDFRTNRNISLAYKLLPIDQNWNTMRNQEIQFLQLPSGSYDLLINGFSRGKQWNSEPVRMTIHILPPWWKTWWAYLFYSLILLALFFISYRFLITRKLAVSENLRLKELSEFRSNLFANITHEFRTPLMIISGLTQNLRDQIGPKSSTKHQPLWDVLDRNITYLLELVNDILDLTKLEIKEEKLQLKQSEVISFIKYIYDSFMAMAKEKKIDFFMNDEIESLMMDFDSDKLTKVVSNLLSNAIKFTPEHGKIVIQLKKTEIKGAAFLSIQVIDDGIGMTEKDVKQIFDRFYRSKNVKAVNSIGSGIGLALTRELVHLMGGNIHVDSTLNVGSRFCVDLPVTNKAPVTDLVLRNINPPKVLKKNTPFDSIVSKGKKKDHLVLIVDDSPDVQFYLTSCLSEKFELIYAENGKAGIKMALKYIPDMIISDVLMPEKTGYEMCCELKNDIRTDHIPIILLTAKNEDKWRIKGLSCGADAYLTKPFIKKELFITIEQLLIKKNKLILKFNKDYTSLVQKNRSTKDRSKFIDKTIQLILKNIDDSNYGPKQLAEELNLSESQVYRKLKAITDKSTSIFIRSVRLEEARNMLETTDKSISEIAYDTGFSDPSWFSRTFKETYGHNPSSHVNSI